MGRGARRIRRSSQGKYFLSRLLPLLCSDISVVLTSHSSGVYSVPLRQDVGTLSAHCIEA